MSFCKNSLLSALLIAGGLSACQLNDSGSARSDVIKARSLFSQANLKGDKIRSLGNNLWLLSSESQGLMLIDKEQRILTSMEGSYESLDLRHEAVPQGQEKFSSVASTINKDSGAVELFSIELDRKQGALTASIHRLAEFPVQNAQFETQCLYRDPVDSHLSLFAVDTLGMIHERLIFNSEEKTLVNIPVRSFVGVPDATRCAVDDLEQALYVAEENIGVWRYEADSEKDANRKAVLLTAPHGQLEGEVSDISLSEDGSVWVVVSEDKRLHRIDGSGMYHSFTLEGVDALEAVDVRRDGESLQLAFYDEAADHFIVGTLSAQDFLPRKRKALLPRVKASAETAAVERFGDAADDPAIWINNKAPEKSLVIGTDKRQGLMVYNLEGKLLQSFAVGRLNNVDLRQGVNMNGRDGTLIAASNRSYNSISLFTIEDDQQVRHLGELPTNLSEVYGLCMYQSASGTYVFVNDTDGRYQQHRITSGGGKPHGQLVREFSLPSQPEGCSADDRSGDLYMGEEGEGIWHGKAEPGETALEMIIPTSEYLVADVEGLDIYAREEKSYLVVSSQGNDSYVVFGLWDDYPLLARFQVARNVERGIDGASETDGLAVTSASLPGYPKGLLVVQDGRNRMPEQPQNFKIVDWEQVDSLLRQ